jgi:hypothetical protein
LEPIIRLFRNESQVIGQLRYYFGSESQQRKPEQEEGPEEGRAALAKAQTSEEPEKKNDPRPQ